MQHNDWEQKIVKQSQVVANDEKWGLRDRDLPVFSLTQKMERQRITFGPLPLSLNGDLPLSREIDWSFQPLYRTCHYQPEVLGLYLKEFLALLSADSQIVYLGDHAEMLKKTEDLRKEISCNPKPILSLGEPMPGVEQSQPADVVLVDCFYERSEELENRVRTVSGDLRRQCEKGLLGEEEAGQEFAQFTDALDSEAINKELEARWEDQLPRLKLRPNSYVIMLGCNTYRELALKFEEMFSKVIRGRYVRPSLVQKVRRAYRKVQIRMGVLAKRNVFLKALIGLRVLKRRLFRSVFGHNSIAGMLYLQYIKRRVVLVRRIIGLRTLYVHHRLVIMRVEREDL